MSKKKVNDNYEIGYFETICFILFCNLLYLQLVEMTQKKVCLITINNLVYPIFILIFNEFYYILKLRLEHLSELWYCNIRTI